MNAKVEKKTLIESATLSLKSGKSRDDTIISLVSEYGVSLSKAIGIAREAAKEAGVASARGRKGGFRSAFYAYLIEGKRSMSEVEKYIKENGSGNDIKHLTHYQGIAELTNAIHSK